MKLTVTQFEAKCKIAKSHNVPVDDIEIEAPIFSHNSNSAAVINFFQSEVWGAINEAVKFPSTTLHAIKTIKGHYGLGLKEAKDMYDIISAATKIS